MAVATETDVQISLRRDLRGDEGGYLTPLLDRAEALLRVRISNFDARLADPQFYDIVVMVEAEAVARVLRADNAGKYSSETEDGYSYQLNFKVASGLLDILPEDWERLGVGGIGAVALEYDGYIRRRYSNLRPDLAFQWQFGCPDSISQDGVFFE